MRKTRRSPVGARPGTLTITPGSPAPVVRLISYDETTLEDRQDVGPDEIRAARDNGRRLWVDVQGLGDEELLRALAELFLIHPLALEDVAHAPIRPKAEPYDHNLLVVTSMVGLAPDGRFDVEQVSLFIGEGYVLTFQEKPGDVLDPVRKRLQLQRSLMRSQGSDYLGYAILDTIIDAYYPVVEHLSDKIEELEERVLDDASPETLRELNGLRRQLLNLRRAIVPQREAVNSLIRDENVLVGQTVRTYLRDTYDHVVQTAEAIEIAREFVSGLINTQLSVVSNRMNEVMKTLTIVASIFVPLTFMAGIYGMNFEYMPELHVRWAYPLLLGGMGAATVGMLIYFRRKGWIGGRQE